MEQRGRFKIFFVYVLVIAGFLGFAQLGNKAITAIAQKIPVERIHTVVIDPGHGGEDGGAISVTGVPESQINLEISLRLEDLMHLLGYRTKMIRTTDRSVYTQGDTIAAKKVSDLRQRVKIVNETDGALLISIHQNTFSEDRYSGAQIFYAAAGEAQPLAEALQEAFRRSINPGSNRMAKKAEGIYLLEHIEQTGVLVECGFLSNHSEEALLRNREYQLKISCIIAVTTAGFLTK